MLLLTLAAAAHGLAASHHAAIQHGAGLAGGVPNPAPKAPPGLSGTLTALPPTVRRKVQGNGRNSVPRPVPGRCSARFALGTPTSHLCRCRRAGISPSPQLHHRCGSRTGRPGTTRPECADPDRTGRSPRTVGLPLSTPGGCAKPPSLTLPRRGAPRCPTPTGPCPGMSLRPRRRCANAKSGCGTCIRMRWPGTTGCGRRA